MTNTSASSNQSDAAIKLVSYDDDWPAQFEAERKLLEAALSRWLTGHVEHVGSTAVPNLIAKPVIDMMAPVCSLEDSRAAIHAVTAIGYVYYPYKPEVMHWFCKPSPAYRTHHLHLVPYGSELWCDRLLFRDTLRNSKSIATEYTALKARLATEFALDREAYTSAKGAFISRVLSVSKASFKA